MTIEHVFSNVIVDVTLLTGTAFLVSVSTIATAKLASYAAWTVITAFCEWKNLVEFWAWQAARKRARRGTK